MYFVTAFFFFGFGGLLALAIRAELAAPGMQFVNYETFNQFFTMHGTIMLLMFATPMFAGFANAFLPLQIGAPDVAFPRLNMFSLLAVPVRLAPLRARASSAPDGAASFGWFAYARCRNAVHSPGIGGDLWLIGLYLLGLRHHPRRGELHHHDHHDACARPDDVPDADLHVEHPGHLDPDPGRLPGARRRPARPARVRTACWARTSSTPRRAVPMLWQHLFWFFGHPEVYVIALPFFGIITEVIPVFSRKPVFGYKAWSPRRSPSARCRSRCGRTTCSSPAR
jgi:cytochrome c oxidase subunit 1